MQRNSRVNPDQQVRSPARSFAQSLDNFYGASRDRRGERAMQQGLGKLGAVLAVEQREQSQEQNEDLYNQGVADAMREDAGQELQGVRKGSIFRQHSKYYTKGLNEQRGRAAGLRFKTDMMAKYDQWEGKNSDDPNDFRNFMNQHTSEFIAQYEDNPDMLNAMLPVINEVSNNTAIQHSTYTNERMQKEQFDAYGEILGSYFDQFNSGEITQEELFQALKDETDDLYDTGEAGANDAFVDYAIMYADANDDVGALFTLAHMHDKGKHKLSVAQQDKLFDAIDSLEVEIERKKARLDDKEKEERRKVITQASNEFFADIASDSTIDPVNWMVENGYGANSEIMKSLGTIQTTVQTARRSAGGTKGEKLLAFQMEMLEATDLPQRLRVIQKYASELGDSVTREMDTALAISQGSGVLSADTFKMNRDGYMENLQILEEGADVFSFDQKGKIATRAEMLYNQFSVLYGRDVDPRDIQAVDEVHQRVTEKVNDMLWKEFADKDMLKKVQDNIPAAKATGLDVNASEQIKRERELLERAATEAGENTVMAQPLEAPQEETPEETPVETNEAGILNSPMVDAITNWWNGDDEEEARPDPVSLTAQDTPFDDAESEQPYDEVREGFYGELMAAFTDGVDNRPTIKSANKVFEEDPEFADEVKRLATKYDVDPMALVAVMQFESGFDPEIRNKAGSGATGLIQFMPKTAASLGTTTDALARMPRAKQMKYVEKYFDQFGSLVRGADVDDFYMAVLYPKAMKKPDGYVLFRKGTKAYQQNRGLDSNGDGTVTKLEASAKVRKLFYS